MRIQTARVAKVTATLCVCVVVAIGIHSATHAEPAPTLVSATTPQLQKIQDLPANVMPPQRNIDCQEVTYGDGTKGCVVNTVFGTTDIEGEGDITFGDSATPVQIDSANGLMPVPGQGMVLGIGTGGTVYGQHLYVYTDIYNHLTRVYNPKKIEYQLTGAPNYTLKDSAGRTMEFNVRNTLAYSGNGSWMIVDGINGSFYRINLATFDMLPFAPSLEMGPNYALHTAQTAISDDGRYAAIAYNTGSISPYYVRVYDLSTCQGTIANQVNGAPLPCDFKDYRPYLSNQLPGFYGAYNVRFTGDDSLTFYAVYNWKSSTSFNVGQYELSPTDTPFHAVDYMALGDSYISGQGEFLYEAGTDTDNNKCHVSPLSYPFIIGGDLFSSYKSVACSGAKTTDIEDDSGQYKPQAKDKRDRSDVITSFMPGYIAQLNFVQQYHPKVVSLSIGGNDIGFANIITSCVSPIELETCYSSTSDRAELVKEIDDLYRTLQSTYTKILQADPGVQLYVDAYPQVAAEGNCANNVHLNASEIQFSQQLISYLDYTIEEAANSVGARYVDTQDALDGNRLCETKSSNVAVNGVTAGNDGAVLGDHVIGAESFHPNVLGHQMLAENILEQTDNFKELMPAPNTSIAAPSPSDALAQELTQHISYDANAIPVPKPEDTLVPELITRGSTQQISVDGTQDGLQPNATYAAVLHSDPINLGNFTSDAAGNLNFSVTIPGAVEPGFHTLHIYGADMAGEQVDIYKQIYVAASLTDYDGDGVPNSANQCLVIQSSGQDADEDGIDDACDPFIGDVPVNLPAGQGVQQSENSISQTSQPTQSSQPIILAVALQSANSPAVSSDSDDTLVLGDTVTSSPAAAQADIVAATQHRSLTLGPAVLVGAGLLLLVCLIFGLRHRNSLRRK